ncbi:MAG: homoaconitate hydratase, partial [Candidatus Delongbacteria bacterium]|nr:homoaconitate hydratase [Candidatus Delongbacteria bacterium]
SRQQAVDCFKSLGVQIIIAESFGAIYERNAINAAFPILTYDDIAELNLQQRNKISIDLETSILTNLETGKSVKINEFSSVQVQIYKKGGLLK